MLSRMRRGDHVRLAPHARARVGSYGARDDFFGLLRQTWAGTVERVAVERVACTCWTARLDALPLGRRGWQPPDRRPLPNCPRCRGRGELDVERVTCRHAAEDCGCYLEPRARKHLPLDDCPRCNGLGIAYRRTLDVADVELVDLGGMHG